MPDSLSEDRKTISIIFDPHHNLRRHGTVQTDRNTRLLQQLSVLTLIRYTLAECVDSRYLMMRRLES
jgi:hypothetical protein